MSEIVIVDYGMANLRSVQKAFRKIGHDAVISSDPDRIAGAGKVVLPGVGAFRDAIARLRETHLDEAVIQHIADGMPFLGICLGLQLLFTRSHEDGIYPGLDVFPGEVVRFPEGSGLKVPHMGWNQLRYPKKSCLFRDIPEESSVYFVHSYYPIPIDSTIVAATADYPTPFTAAIVHENVWATQFHPEKSQAIGLRMLRNFAEL